MQRDFVTRSNELFAAIAGWSMDHRWWVVGLSVVALGAALAAASTTQVDSSYEAYFDPNDPTYRHYEQYREDFGSDEVSYILYEAPGFEHGPWNIEVMRRIVEITDAIEAEVPFIYEAQSVASVELLVGSEDSIDILELRDDFPETQAELLALRDRYLAKPMIVGGIVSADAQHGALLIEMDRSSTDPLDSIRADPEGGDGLDNLYPQATEAVIDAILARPQYEGIRFYHSGDVPLNSAYNRIIGEESLLLNGITVLVIGLILSIFFRSVVGVLAPIAVVQLTVLCTVGFIGLMGWGLDLSFSAIPTLITAIGVAHSVHIISEFRRRFAAVGDRREALVGTLYLVGTPCLLTSLTTAVGFGSMAFVPIKSIARSGVYSSVGVMAAFFLSLTLLMALLSFGRATPKPRSSGGGAQSEWLGRALRAVAAFVIARRLAVIAGFAVLFLASGAGIAQLVVDSNWLDDFSERVPLKNITIHMDEVMGGATNMILLFDSGEPEAIKEPAVLRDIDRVQTWANEQGLVRKSYSIVDIVKDLNQTFHADDPAWHRLPETRALVAQYLLLYESAGGSEASDYVSSDYRRAALELRLALEATSATVALVENLETMLAEEPLEATSMSLTGIGALWLKLLDYIVTSQIQGFLTAFSVIALMMCLLFRSLKTGLISMAPNLSPVFLTLGAMGWLGIALDYSKVAIASVAIGIAVDDTIHLALRYRHEFLRCRNYEEALLEAVGDVGRALVITSITLVFGFLVLLLSVLDSQATQGLLLATTIVSALVADFLLMPALILTFQPFGPEGVRQPHREKALNEAA